MSGWTTWWGGLFPVVLIFGTYGLVSAIIFGVIRERDGDWSENADSWATFGWPIAIIFFTLTIPLWCLTWLGRGPVKLVKFLRKKRVSLPKATVVGLLILLVACDERTVNVYHPKGRVEVHTKNNKIGPNGIGEVTIQIDGESPVPVITVPQPVPYAKCPLAEKPEVVKVNP